jgi:hypothetical protein
MGGLLDAFLPGHSVRVRRHVYNSGRDLKFPRQHPVTCHVRYHQTRRDIEGMLNDVLDAGPSPEQENHSRRRGQASAIQGAAQKPPPCRPQRQLLLDDPDLHLRFYIRVKTNRDPVHTERLDRLVQIHLPLLHREALCLELFHDIG